EEDRPAQARDSIVERVDARLDALLRGRLLADAVEVLRGRGPSVTPGEDTLVVDRVRLRRGRRRGSDRRCGRIRRRDRRRRLLPDRLVGRGASEERRSECTRDHDARGKRGHAPKRGTTARRADGHARLLVWSLVDLRCFDRTRQRATEDLVVTRFVRAHRIAPRARRPAIWIWRSFSIAWWSVAPTVPLLMSKWLAMSS